MSGNDKRRDNKGRVLRAGESWRTDGRYMFRYPEGHFSQRTEEGTTTIPGDGC